jgi:hypothetical protein
MKYIQVKKAKSEIEILKRSVKVKEFAIRG